MSNFYACQDKSIGREIFRFKSRKERENWLTHNHQAKAVTAKWAESAYKAKGVFTRPGFVDPKETDSPATR